MQFEHEYLGYADAVTAWFGVRTSQGTGLQTDAAVAELGKRLRSLATGLADEPTAGPLDRRERLARLSRLLDRTDALPPYRFGMPDLVLLRGLLADPYEEVPDDRGVAQRAACLWLTDAARISVFRMVTAMRPPEPLPPEPDAGPVPVDQIAPQVVLRWLVIASDDPRWDDSLDAAMLSTTRFDAVVEQPLRAFFAQVPAFLPPDLV